MTPRAEGQGPGDGDALLHAAGEGVGVGLLEAAQAHVLNELATMGSLSAVGTSLIRQAVGDVFRDREPGEGGVLLKDHAAVAARSGDRLPVDQNFAGVRAVEAGDEAQDGGFAAAGGSQEDAEFADVAAVGGESVFDLEAHVVQRLDACSRGARRSCGRGCAPRSWFYS